MQTNPGLEGIVVADTTLSLVDGAAGRLVVGGFDVETLASRHDVEAVAHLLLVGRLPDAAEHEAFRASLARGRAEAFERLGGLGDALERRDAMDALRASVAHLEAVPGERSIDETLRIVAAVGVYAAAWARKRSGRALVAPSLGARHAEDFLRMLHDRTPTPAEAAGLDAYLVTVADHGMNASTFAARVVVSTESDDVSAVVAGIAALKGRLHGGAPGPVLDMLDAVGTPERAEAVLARAIASGERIMGMGHRIYRVRDPRAAVLEAAIERLEAAGEGGDRLRLARSVERTAERLLAAKKPDRPLRANVEFYTAVLLEALGLPRELFTATFATGRVVGWLSHCREQRRTGRLIRPASRYVGPMPDASRDCA
ncbi:MAG: citrate synthase [Polyangiales bacterium]